MMEVRSARHPAKPPAGQHPELLTQPSPVEEEDEEGAYGFFCRRSSEHSPKDELDYMLIDDSSLPSPGGSVPMRTWALCPRLISLTQEQAGRRGAETGSREFVGSGEVLPFDGCSQARHGHVLQHDETGPVWLPQAGQGRDYNTPDWEEDELKAISVSPGETKTWPGRLVSVSVSLACSQPEPRCFGAVVTGGPVTCTLEVHRWS
ncbi:uncharacterized protein LJ264_008637 [Porphyrio hochstetteri]